MSYSEQVKKQKRPASIIGQQVQNKIDSLTSSPEEQEAEAGQYQAFKKGVQSKQEIALEINLRENETIQIYYFDIEKKRFKGNNLLFITTAKDIYTIEGKNISAVKDLLRDNRIASINEFDPLKYAGFPGSNEPLIEVIEVTAVTEKKEVYEGV